MTLRIPSGNARSAEDEDVMDEPIEPAFVGGLKGDFTVLDGERAARRFSEGWMFARMIGSESTPPEGATTYEASWGDPESSEYAAAATLEARERDCRARSAFPV